MTPGSTLDEYHQEYIGAERSIEIWCVQDEVEEGELLESVDEPTKNGDA